jgi:hypothetical protein
MTHRATNGPSGSNETTGRTPSDTPLRLAEPVEVAVLSLRDNPPTARDLALVQVADDLFTATDQLRLIFLPGWVPGWPEHPAPIARLARRVGADVLFEQVVGRGGRWQVVTADGVFHRVSIAQRFGSSGEAERDTGLVRDLVVACRPGGERRLALAGSDVGLLCCGENNVLRNAQARGNEVMVRHGVATTLFDGARVVFNGAHTNMGNWAKLNRRFEWLSRGPRLAMYTTNNSARGWTSALGAWWGGERLATGEEVLPAGQARDVRLVRGRDDQARAVVVQLARGEGAGVA